MNNLPLISIIIPAYNVEKQIVKALDSIKNQTCGDIFEIIIINDGSTDQTESTIKKWQQENPKYNLQLVTQTNRGVSVARNTGLKIAKGKYIALLDSDDEWLPQKTEKQLQILEKNPEIDFLATCGNNEKIRFPYKVNERNLAEITLKKLLIRNIGQTPTVLFKRKILENTGYFDEKMRHAEDANYWLRISKKNGMFILNESLVVTGSGKKSFGESGLSANLREMEKGFQKNIKEIFLAKRINFVEYFCIVLFSKIKYLLRFFR